MLGGPQGPGYDFLNHTGRMRYIFTSLFSVSRFMFSTWRRGAEHRKRMVLLYCIYKGTAYSVSLRIRITCFILTEMCGPAVCVETEGHFLM